MRVRGRVRLFAAAGATLAAFGMVLLSAWQSEPRHGGKTLTEWAVQLTENIGRYGPAQDEARTAIRSIGTNGIPVLIRLVRTKDSKIQRMLWSIVPRPLHHFLPKNNATDRRKIGVDGLVALNTNAAGVVLELIQIAKNHPDDDGRYRAVCALSNMGIASQSAVPFLIQCLTNRDARIRDQAVIGIGQKHIAPDVCVPALTNHLNLLVKNGEIVAIQEVIRALRNFGTNSESALPSLLPLLEHKKFQVRNDVTNALSWIQPDEL